jgi:hypothetical protein
MGTPRMNPSMSRSRGVSSAEKTCPMCWYVGGLFVGNGLRSETERQREQDQQRSRRVQSEEGSDESQS